MTPFNLLLFIRCSFLQRLTRYFFLLAAISSMLISSAALASSYIIIDNETSCILDQKNSNDSVPVASLTKIALATTLIDWSKLSGTSLDKVVEVPPNAPPQGASNPIGLESGDLVSLRDLLYLSLLASDSEAALTIANAVGQSLPNKDHLTSCDNFVAQMNALALELQMKHTLFLNPSGLDAPSKSKQPYSSAADLARLTRYAYSKPGLSFYVSQKSRLIHFERQGKPLEVTIQNNNKLLNTEHIDGVTTGHSERAGDCIILTSEHTPEVKHIGDTVYTTPRRVIVVLLNSNNLFDEGLSLHHRAWNLYTDWAAAGRPLNGKFL